MATNYDPLGGYATNPGYQTGAGAYGEVPGAIDIPPNIYSQLGSIDPNLAAKTGTAGSTIMSELQGELSPETIGMLQQNAAQFGTSTGMPLSQFAGNQGLRSLGLNVEQQQRQGIQDYLSMMKGLGETLTSQQLAADIASRNATMAAAPNPQAAAQQQMADWQQKFQQTAGGGGFKAPNPAGGSGSPMGGAPTSQAPNQVYGPTGTNTGTNQYPTNAQGYYNLPTGNTYGNVSPSGGGGMIDQNGDEWVNYGGQYMNLTTGEMSASPPSGVQPTSSGSMYMGANPDQVSDSGSYLESALGFDTSGMSQNEIDTLAYMYGYNGQDTSQAPDYGSSSYYDYSLPADYGSWDQGYTAPDYSSYDSSLPADYGSWDLGYGG